MTDKPLDDKNGVVVLNPEAPRIATNHCLFPILEEDLEQTSQDLLKAHETAKAMGPESREVDNSLEHLPKYADPRKLYPELKPVVFVGDQGVGKTRIMDILTGSQGFAVPEATPGRGTYVPHEYRGPEKGQTEKVVIKACCKSNLDIRQIIEMHVEHIYKVLKGSADDLVGETDNQDDIFVKSGSEDDSDAEDDLDPDLEEDTAEDDPDECDIDELREECKEYYKFYACLFSSQSDFETMTAQRSVQSINSIR